MRAPKRYMPPKLTSGKKTFTEIKRERYKPTGMEALREKFLRRRRKRAETTFQERDERNSVGCIGNTREVI